MKMWLVDFVRWDTQWKESCESQGVKGNFRLGVWVPVFALFRIRSSLFARVKSARDPLHLQPCSLSDQAGFTRMVLTSSNKLVLFRADLFNNSFPIPH